MTDCPHDQVEPVELSTGEVVATICVECLDQLPPNYGCTDCEWLEIRMIGIRRSQMVSTAPCSAHRSPYTSRIRVGVGTVG